MLNMAAVLVFLTGVLLIGVTDGVKIFCKATQPHITTECFGSPGGTVEVLLVTQILQDWTYGLKKNNSIIIVSGTSLVNHTRYSFSTGIFTIKDIDRTDDDTYSIEIFNDNGVQVVNTKFKVSIQAPVSSPRLSWQCLSGGEQTVSCSAGGDRPRYRWSLDGHPLKDTHLHSGNSTTSNITLKLGLSGLLSCSVCNDVSEATANQTLSVCGGFIYVNCTSNGTHISQWVYKDNNTLCIETTPTEEPDNDNKTDFIFVNCTSNGTHISQLVHQDNNTFCIQATGEPGHNITMATTFIIGGSLSAVVLLLIVALGVYCAQQKKKTSKDRADAEDATYVNISVLQRQGKPREQTKSEVEYGEVKVAPRDRQTVETNMDDCVEIFCNATQPHITTECFGSPGGTVDVLLVTQFLQDRPYTLKKNNTIIIVSGTSLVNHTRYSFNVITGIFTIKDIDRTDDDTYSIEIFNDYGVQVVHTKFKVSIQAPVSSPRLSWQCLSGGEQRVSCSAGGDRPRYRWSLDGHPLNDTHLLSGNSTTSNITLKLGLSGLLSCSVCNDVSEATANQTLSVCGGFIYVNCTSNGTHISQWVHKDNNTLCIETTPTEEPDNDNKTGHISIIARSLSVMALLLVALGVYCALKKKGTSKPQEDGDVVYGRQRKRRESEVEDGRVKVVQVAGRRLKLIWMTIFCNATQPHITTECFGSPGGTVEVLLVTQFLQDRTYTLKKNNSIIIVSGASLAVNHRYSFNVSTGIFTIKDIDRTDDDTYSIDIFNGAGIQVVNTKFNVSIQGLQIRGRQQLHHQSLRTITSDFIAVIEAVLPLRLSNNNNIIGDVTCYTVLCECFNVVVPIAPVSSPRLSWQCLSGGEQTVSCSAGGDRPRYRWSLDGHPLKDTHLLSGNSTTSNITLKLGLSGLLSCSVCNDVSEATANQTLSVCGGFIYVNCTSNGTHISQWVYKDNNTLCIETTPTEEPDNDNKTDFIFVNCTSNGTHISQLVHKDNNTFCIETTGEPATTFIIGGSLSAVVLLLIVALGVYCAQQKKKTSKDRADAEDVTYADISVLQRQGKPREQTESEVEYGEVKVAPRDRQTVETNMDDCVEIFCNATQPHITTECFGSPGGTVDVLLVTQFLQDRPYTLKKNNTIIIVSGTSLVNHTRYSFNVITGIFTIKDIDRTDDDTYSIEIFNDYGVQVVHTKFKVSIQAPVSSPRLSWQCLSGGEQRVSCSAGGDRPRYRWSLDGHPLNDTHLLSGNSTTSNITLKLGPTTIPYALRQHRLRNQTMTIKTGHISIIARSLSVMALLLVALGVYCALKKKGTSKPQGVKIFCNATQPHITTECFGSPGGTVEVLLVTQFLQDRTYTLKKNNSIIIVSGASLAVNHRYSFNVSTGIFTIKDIDRTDDDTYSIDIFNGAGIQHRSPLPACPGSVCPVESRRCPALLGGDRPRYRWSLDGHPLKDTHLLSGNSTTSNITLKLGLSGLLSCSVCNDDFIFVNCTSNGTHISQLVHKDNNTFCIETTGEPATTFIIGGSLSAVVLLLIVALGVYCAQQKKKTSKDRADAEDTSLCYSVRGKPREQTESEVEYGEVKVASTGQADGVEIFCNATQPHITTECFGSPGGTVEVLLVTQILQDWTYTLKKNNSIIIVSGSSLVNHTRYSFNNSTGIFTIKDIDRTDDGTYSIEIFNGAGIQVVNTKFKVSIQDCSHQVVVPIAPVSSPRLSWQCLSGGEQRVSCSAGGDRPRYRWSLDGHPLKDTHLLSGNSTTSNITLKLGLSGLLSCSVCNDVSQATANQTLSVCVGHISIIARSLSVMALLLVALGVYCALKKKGTSKPQGVKIFCNATQPHITTECFGSPGGTVEVLLVTQLLQDWTSYTLKKNNTIVIEKGSRLNHNRYSFDVITGIFTIKDIDRTDNDTYSIEIFNDNGVQVVNTKFNVSIQGVKIFCNATQPHITTECFGSPGGTVEVLLVTQFLQDWTSYTLKKNNAVIIVHGSSQNHTRYSFSTGIFTIKDIDRTDDDTYSIEIFNGAGIQVVNTKFKVSIQDCSHQVVVPIAPVSSPRLSWQCLSGGEQRVSCSAGGDRPRYRWSLDGHPLKDTHLLSGNSTTSNITLKLGLSGLLSCSVCNDVSEATANQTLSVCGGHISIIARSLSVMALLLVALGVYCALKKKGTSKPQGVEIFCNATQPNITTECFGSPGGTVEVLLVTQILQDWTYALKKNNTLNIVSGTSLVNHTRYSFNNSTGIFTIKDIDRTDDDTYSIEIFNGAGIQVVNTKFNVSIQAPVSSPRLSWQCLSGGEQTVSCSAGGDRPRYRWSLDGHPLNDTHLHSGNSTTSNITLKLGLSGLLSCSVCNDVSEATANQTLSVCGGFIYVNCTSNGTHISQWVHKDNNTLCIETTPTEEPDNDNKTDFIFVNCTSNGTHISQWVHKENNTFCIQATGEPGHNITMDRADAEDVTYADISVLQRQGKPREQTESEVEYGEVKVAPRGRQTVETNMDDCLYAQPRRMRR
ncbi:T-cell surface antigen CD2 [Merluccius polli]|uniref:T-cell surface antigen CD2 n=1 Tax=Merluccius polli TaxID=89951 RepID=A0AA47MGS9_MERPO|nr:T-cell surface antigen CD2 [Merluccius polli]